MTICKETNFAYDLKSYQKFKDELIQMLEINQKVICEVSNKKPIFKNNVTNILVFENIELLIPELLKITKQYPNLLIKPYNQLDYIGTFWFIIKPLN